ncbi:cysteine desulfurase [Thermoanaerobaculum aquaticum]|uniref:cysteine desulfurase n=1 Tax=Thermoanaerobaculum aquaticum TaxID=1312852 RepID=A0A062Y131_9BACT|nr:cysteine desulfurase family protein [Thermoanaerobaculum aquaticum]KDA54106.1 cysteine desulfurase [Thermoanaerobaculum aquaticum]
MTKVIYLDYNATTPVDPQVLQAMLPAFTEHFGNASSRTHAYGWAAAALVDQARTTLAKLLGANPEELVFTSGATEANNLAIKGLARSSRKRHIVTTAIEHPAVLEACDSLQREGFTVTRVPVGKSGVVDPEAVVQALTDDTLLVSVMLVNNEIGTIQPVPEVARLCHQRGVLVHCDATQAPGKLEVNVQKLGVDLLSLSAHKFYGPKGVGLLYVRRQKPPLRLEPLLHGGGQEGGLRSGTLNVPGIVGMAKALELSVANLEEESKRQAALRDRLREKLLEAFPRLLENGDASQKVPNTLNVSFVGLDGGALVASLPRLAVSPASACATAKPKPSHVLLALGRTPAEANSALRFSLGRPTTEEEVEEAAAMVAEAVRKLTRG